MTNKELYTKYQRKRTRARKQMDRVGRWSTAGWKLRGLNEAYTDFIVDLGNEMLKEELGI